MGITEEYIGKSGVKYILEYFGGNKQAWGLIGGTIEPGETFEIKMIDPKDYGQSIRNMVFNMKSIMAI